MTSAREVDVVIVGARVAGPRWRVCSVLRAGELCSLTVPGFARWFVSEGRVIGVDIADDAGAQRVRARLVVGADGRASRVAELAGAATHRNLNTLRSPGI